MRILWSSNAPWIPSGYGVQTKHIVSRLQGAGHSMAISAFCGVGGAVINRESIPIYPGGAPMAYGFDVLPLHSRHWKADIAISLIDAWTADPRGWPQDVRWVPYFPIDSEPVSPNILKAVSGAYERIVFSRFACQQMEAANLSYEYVPHVTDTDLYSPGDKRAARDATGLPQDVFIVGVVAANKGLNPCRKSWPQLLEAWVLFAKSHPDAVLYVHSEPGTPGNAHPLAEHVQFLAGKHAVDLTRRVIWTDQYMSMLGIPDEYMRDAYRSFDVLLNPSMGEGFGVPILEAQACGCPVIAGAWTAMDELVWGGWRVRRDEAVATYIPGYHTEMFTPDVDAILDRLEQSYTCRNDATIAAAAREGALPYDVNTVVQDHWLPVLGRLEERIKRGHGELKLVRFD